MSTHTHRHTERDRKAKKKEKRLTGSSLCRITQCLLVYLHWTIESGANTISRERREELRGAQTHRPDLSERKGEREEEEEEETERREERKVSKLRECFTLLSLGSGLFG